MVFECCKKLNGKRVLQKFYLRCQHKQRQTGKNEKSVKPKVKIVLKVLQGDGRMMEKDIKDNIKNAQEIL